MNFADSKITLKKVSTTAGNKPLTNANQIVKAETKSEISDFNESSFQTPIANSTMINNSLVDTERNPDTQNFQTPSKCNAVGATDKTVLSSAEQSENQQASSTKPPNSNRPATTDTQLSTNNAADIDYISQFSKKATVSETMSQTMFTANNQQRKIEACAKNEETKPSANKDNQKPDSDDLKTKSISISAANIDGLTPHNNSGMSI